VQASKYNPFGYLSTNRESRGVSGMKLIKGQRIVTMIITEQRREMSRSKSKRRMRMTGTGWKRRRWD